MFAIRGYNTEAKKEDWYKLRRGWLTRTNAGYSFFYTDNFHAAYYCKMAIDGYVPTVDELIETYNARKFPARFMQNTSEEREKIAIINGKDPGIQTAGYKIAHIINVGRDYFFKGVDQSLQNIVDRYYSRGEREDWQQVTDSTGEHWSRNNFEVVPEAKEYLIAEFLRFVHPMNYFLTPKPTCIIKTNEYKDIAEYQPLVNYVMNKFSEMYGDAYEEYLDLVMIDKENYKAQNARAQELFPDDKEINLVYGVKVVKAKESAESKPKAQKVSNNKSESIDTSSYNPKWAELKIGKLANTVLRERLESGAASEEEVQQMQTADYSKQVFHINYPLLSKIRDPDRYYKKPLNIKGKNFYLCNDWYEKPNNNDRIYLEPWLEKHE